MDDDELRATIGDQMVAFIAAVVVFNTALSQRLGLGASDTQFLTLLQNHGPLTAGRLAELSDLSTGTVTGVIDRLERSGYARRERDTADRRKVIVVLVPEAMATLHEHYAGYGAHLAGVLATRDAEELATISRFFADLGADAAG
jgi:DNA-binding MarR family transcriptional regulator